MDTKNKKERGLVLKKQKAWNAKGLGIISINKEKEGGSWSIRNKKRDGTLCPYEEKERGIKTLEIRSVKCDGFWT
jgi:hypothetical protein